MPELETYSVDLSSLGASDDWRSFASPEGLAQAVGVMLDALQVERCSVVGNSMGGIAAQALAVLNRAFDLDLRPELPKITASTLVIRGEFDAARTRAHVEELLADIPESTALEIPGAGHSPSGRQPADVLARAPWLPPDVRSAAAGDRLAGVEQAD